MSFTESAISWLACVHLRHEGRAWAAPKEKLGDGQKTREKTWRRAEDLEGRVRRDGCLASYEGKVGQHAAEHGGMF